MENNLLARLDRSITVSVVVSLLAFLFIHDYDSKRLLPLLMWAIIGAIAASFSQKIPCFLLLASWFSPWLVAFKPSLQKNWPLVLGCLIPQWIGLRLSYDRYEQSGALWPITSKNAWFWVPAFVFVLSSLLTVYKVFRKKYDQREIEQI